MAARAAFWFFTQYDNDLSKGGMWKKQKAARSVAFV
jgi:hypothetical protein